MERALFSGAYACAMAAPEILSLQSELRAGCCSSSRVTTQLCGLVITRALPGDLHHGVGDFADKMVGLVFGGSI
ncbi:hypothetical protein GSbR_03730 [Geobacter sp. SVR]|nr:hypothetical protein GSVR_40770 [Geobacter sp. SVR]GCF83773.1 hypothetical protein GSbR_03730 [Geobacter sp. SVR]